VAIDRANDTMIRVEFRAGIFVRQRPIVADQRQREREKSLNRKRIFSLSVAAALLVGLATTSVASAAPTSSHSGGANAVQTGVVRIDPNNPSVAYVTGRYSCPAGFAHLFVSVKQVASGLPDSALKQEGSSSISSAFVERHPEPTEFTCDATWHTGTWQITSDPSVPGYEYGFGGLVPGQVYVQFCWDGPNWHAYSEQFARASY
jgi:hypothetical protein